MYEEKKAECPVFSLQINSNENFLGLACTNFLFLVFWNKFLAQVENIEIKI